MRRAAAALAALAALAGPAAATAAERTTLADVEDEVMCPICGTLLELSEAPQAQRQRVFIRRLIDQGRSKEQIKQALVAEYGGEVLATPDDSGFDLAAWVVPVAGLTAMLLVVALALRRWRDGETPGPGGEGAPGGAEAERLDADMARYDL